MNEDYFPNSLFGLPDVYVDRAFTSFDEPVYIDAGPSPYGGSRIGCFIKCPQLYSWQYECGISLGNEALEWGSLGHTFAAHAYARMGAEQGGVLIGMAEKQATWPSPLAYVTDPEMIVSPLDACKRWCSEHDVWRDFAEVVECWTELFDRFPRPPGRILGVEIPVTMVVGYTERSGLGLYVVEPDRPIEIPLMKANDPNASILKRGGWVDPRIFEGVGWRHVVTGAEVDPCLLEMPGHPEHGRPILSTKRLDAVLERRRDGTMCPEVWDHKNLMRIEPKKAGTAYRVDLSFNVYRIFGEQVWGSTAFDRASVVFHAVQKRPGKKGGARQFERLSVPPAPEVIRRLPGRIMDAEHRLALLQLETLRGDRILDDWDAAINADQSPCSGRYGECRAQGICCEGRAAKGYR